MENEKSVISNFLEILILRFGREGDSFITAAAKLGPGGNHGQSVSLPGG